MSADTVSAHCKHCDSERVTKTAEKAGMSATALGIFRCADCGQECVIWPEDLR